jgi:hypothetical protein
LFGTTAGTKVVPSNGSIINAKSRKSHGPSFVILFQSPKHVACSVNKFFSTSWKETSYPEFHVAAFVSVT